MVHIRPIIQQLNPTLINQIAAGEVIERPAAALKEIVENAIDAKATHIDVVLRDGGKSLIQVTDNGVGMTESDILLAIQRHATSKLPTNDLFNITTFGFRGEALPSIGSVGRLSIISHPVGSDQTTAKELFVEGGVISPIRPVAYPTPGTRITIKDLFYATPARLKFLKTDATELTACLDVIKRLALAHPEVSFVCATDSKQLLNYPACTTLGERFAAVLSQQTLENVRLCDGARDGIQVTGMISLPTFHKSQATDQFFFVNNRPVKDKLLMGILKAGYQDYLERGRHPVVALFVTVDPAEVDVNVHPTKAEVRFRDSQGVRSLLIGTLKSTLLRHGQETGTQLASDALMRFKGNQIPYSDPLPRMGMSQRPTYTNATIPQSYSYRQSPASFSTAPTTFSRPISSSPVYEFPEVDSTAESNTEINRPLGMAKAQLNKTYIISETAEGLILVDQHAAHERIQYEKLKQAYLHQGVAKQLLVVPLMMAIDSWQREIITQHADLLQKLGFTIELFGDEAVFRAIPALLSKENPTELITDLWDDLKNADETLNVTDLLLDFLSTHACHTSIRAGDILSVEAMNALLRQIEATPNSGQCNHGRPTYITLNFADIEHLFGRR